MEILNAVIWKSGKPYLSEILYELQLSFDILYAHKHTISSVHETCLFLNQLYPHRSFDIHSPKLFEIKGGEFIHLIILDKSPNPGENIKATQLKQKLRSKYQINFLHISDNQEAALQEHLNTCFQAPIKQLQDRQPTYKAISQNSFDISLISYQEPKSLQDKFKLLSNICWAMLRNWEENEWGEDIDILVDNKYNAAILLEATKELPIPCRVRHSFSIDNQNYFVDIRHIGDRYYDQHWQKEILRTRIQDSFYYRINDYNYPFALIYHGLIHKKIMKHTYASRIQSLLPNLSSANSKELLHALTTFLRQHKYTAYPPKDLSVGYFYPSPLALLHKIQKRFYEKKYQKLLKPIK